MFTFGKPRDTGEVLQAGLAQAWRDGNLVDVEIICKAKTWKAHKVVLSAQSEFFRKAFSGDFKSNEIKLNDDKPEIVDTMLAFFYTRKYGAKTTAKSPGDPMTFDVKVYTIANKYIVETLKGAAVEKFKTKAQQQWSEPAFTDAITKLYENGPAEGSSFHKAVFATITSHGSELYGQREKHEAFHGVVAKIPELAIGLSDALAASILAGKEKKKLAMVYRWPSCNMIFQVVPPAFTIGFSFSCPSGCKSGNYGYWNGFKAQIED